MGYPKVLLSKNNSKKIVDNNKELIDKAIDAAFENIPVSKARSRLFEIIEDLLYMGTNEQLNSGVVIAGFGEKEAFPTLAHMVVEGLFDNKLKRGPISKSTIGVDSEAIIAAYAQREMVARFMEGIDPLYKEIMAGYLSQLPEQFSEHLIRNLKRYKKSERQKLKNNLIKKCKKNN